MDQDGTNRGNAGAPETTGRYIVLLREDATESAARTLRSAAGVNVATTRDGVASLGEAGGADGVVFDQIGAATYTSPPAFVLSVPGPVLFGYRSLAWGGWFCTDEAGTDAAAAALHNTRTVARNSYVHPLVFEAEDEAVEEAWRGARRTKWSKSASVPRSGWIASWPPSGEPMAQGLPTS